MVPDFVQDLLGLLHSRIRRKYYLGIEDPLVFIREISGRHPLEQETHGQSDNDKHSQITLLSIERILNQS